MLGAIVYRLRVAADESLPGVHGHLLHGACFHLLQDFSPKLSRSLHEAASKPFTSSALSLPPEARAVRGRVHLAAGTSARWRVTALQDDVLEGFLSVPPGKEIRLGSLPLRVEEVVADPQAEPRSGLMDEADLVRACCQIPQIAGIRMDFLSATSFRSGTHDVPWPAPELVFGSLADKWAGIAPDMADPMEIREMAQAISLESWRGRSQRLFFRRDRGVNGFTGSFQYGLQMLPTGTRSFFLLLASFSEFAGVGRLTAQGMGQARATAVP